MTDYTYVATVEQAHTQSGIQAGVHVDEGFVRYLDAGYAYVS